uniref:hypothetical protein n=1 Tax=uncultured Roseovarius sp. TaxID=293344 RepID=UPI0025F181B2
DSVARHFSASAIEAKTYVGGNVAAPACPTGERPKVSAYSVCVDKPSGAGVGINRGLQVGPREGSDPRVKMIGHRFAKFTRDCLPRSKIAELERFVLLDYLHNGFLCRLSLLCGKPFGFGKRDTVHAA